MLRSLVFVLAVLPGCTREAPRAPNKKPRVEVVVLSTSGERFDDPAWVNRLSEAWKGEAQRCVLPECALLKLSTATGELPSLGYEASVATELDAGPTRLAANLAGAPEERKVELGGIRLQILGVNAAAGGAEQTLQRITQEVYKRGAQGTIVVSDLCRDELQTIVQRNAREWPFVLLAVGKTCGERVVPKHIVATLVVSPGEGGYSRASLTFDRNTGALLKGDSSFVELK